ncbi:uncharacterized protein LOC126574242 [Anopheles aquasalis]|uniref:uncharacterized protein LOC126574242 n=1 Tax=Anopheles aquasalis TaxID=42839 RepID=UPI00215A6E78|nr:uncharacterized protein LOC126574242 [Anopheles aquasalis]
MAAASSATSSSPPQIKVKSELCTDNDTIKELAETAMNDILGWYGLDSVDRLDLTANHLASTSGTGAIDEEAMRHQPTDQLTTDATEASHSMVSSGSSTSSKSSSLLLRGKGKHCGSSGGTSHQLPSSTKTRLQQHRVASHLLALARQQQPPEEPPGASNVVAASSAPSTSVCSDRGRPVSAGSPTASGSSGIARNGIVLHHHHHQQHHHHQRHSHQHQQQQQQQQQQQLAQVPLGESSTSEKDSSRESSKSPMMMKLHDKLEQICQWCRKVIPAHQPGILGTTEGMIFCTEACFAQSRRASFKRAKTCDWCRHVRHAVSYVDFQDGASQLQFCSDKCLNQYKMQIFCNETQAHLEMNPHLKEKSSPAGSLITPELWMKNCKSCSMSPVSDRSESVSPVPSLPLRSSPEPSPIASVRHSPTNSTSLTSATASASVKKPLISVAPPSKLLSKSLQSAPSLQSRVASPKGARKRQRGSHRSAGSQGMVKRAASLHQTADGGSGAPGNGSSTLNNNNVSTIPNNNLSISPSTMKASCSVITPNVQDLRLLQKKHHSLAGAGGMAGAQATPYDGRDTVLVGSSATAAVGTAPPTQPPHFLPPALNLMRPPFFPMNPGLRFNPQHLLHPSHLPPAMPPPASPLPGAPPPPAAAAAAAGMGHPSTRPPPPPPPPIPSLLGLGAPPVTILVPYPIIVPLPLPIPVPIPVIDFLKAALPKEATPVEVVPQDDTAQKQETDAATAAEAEEEAKEMVDASPDPRHCDQSSDVGSDGPLDFTLAAVGKRKDKAILLYDRLTASATTADNNRPASGSRCAASEEEQHQQQLAYALAASADEAMEETTPGAAATCPVELRKFKIKRLDGMLHEMDHTATPGAEGVDREAGKDDELEDDMERERSEMVDRSRPLRKRKRLVVAQQPPAPPPPPPRTAAPPKEPSMGEDGMAEEEEPDYCCPARTGGDP